MTEAGVGSSYPPRRTPGQGEAGSSSDKLAQPSVWAGQ